MTIQRHDSSGILSLAVEHGDTVYLAGIVEKLEQDIKGQTKEVLDEIDRLLAKCGTNKSKLLSATVYISDMAQKDAMNQAWLAWIDPKNPPTRACIAVELGSPTTLVEIVVP